jgi:putative intracellular protease/amidase
MVLGAVEPSRIRLLILPGGDRWEQEEPDPALVALIGRLDPGTQPVAAICGATVALGRADLFRGRRHTSNGLDYLIAQVPGYRSSAEYVDAPAVRDRGLITASGLAAVEFAREIFAELGVFSPEDLTLWYRLFRG